MREEIKMTECERCVKTGMNCDLCKYEGDMYECAKYMDGVEEEECWCENIDCALENKR